MLKYANEPRCYGLFWRLLNPVELIGTFDPYGVRAQALACASCGYAAKNRRCKDELIHSARPC